MRNGTKFLGLGVGFLLFLAVGMVLARSSAGKSFQASMRIVQPLQATNSEKIEFGEIKPGENGGTVKVTASNQRFMTGDVEAEEGFHPAKFKITGAPNTAYHIEIPDQTVSNDDGPGVLLATDFEVFSKTVGSVTTEGQFDEKGKDTLKVGGTLQVPAGSPEGEYEGDLLININY